MLKGYGISFDLYPIDEKHYRLVVKEAVNSSGMVWSYDEMLSYGEEIDAEHFHLNVVKRKKAQDAQYRFLVLEEGSPYGAVNVSQKSRYSTILEISYTDNEPLRAQEYANALAEAYKEQKV